MISKELLSAVLENDYNERLVDIIQINGNLLQTFYDCGSGKPTGLGIEINVYELAHKCKEWAFKQGYYLPIVYCGDTVHCGISKTDKGYIWGQNSTYIENTEPEAIFKACQWILDNKTIL